MADRVLTQNGVDNSNVDGAVFNNIAVGGVSGRLKYRYQQCDCFFSASNILTMKPGELVICGQRWVFDEATSFSFANAPNQPINYDLIARVTLQGQNITPEIFTRQCSPLTQDNIYATIAGGTFEMVVCKFIQNKNGTLSNLIMVADVLNGSNGSESFIVGNVQTQTLPPNAQAIVDISPRTTSSGQTVQDFSFGIPSGNDGLTTIKIAGVPQTEVAFASDPQLQLNAKSDKATTLAGYGITDGVSMQFTDSSGAINYIGKNIGTLVINSGTHIFTNCTGTISYSGTTAKVFINNSPSLSISGITANNWRNVYRDGKAEFVARNTSIEISEEQTTVVSGISLGDSISIQTTTPVYNVPLIYIQSAENQNYEVSIYANGSFEGTLIILVLNGTLRAKKTTTGIINISRVLLEV